MAPPPTALISTAATGLGDPISTDLDRYVGVIKRPVFQGDNAVLGYTYDARRETFNPTILSSQDDKDSARISVNLESYLRICTATSDETSSQKLALDIHGHYDDTFGLSVLGKKIVSLETHMEGEFLATSKQNQTDRAYFISWNYTVGTVSLEPTGKSVAKIDDEDTHVISDVVYGKVISLMMVEQVEHSETSVELNGSGSGKLKLDLSKLANWFTKATKNEDEQVAETGKGISLDSSFKKDLTKRSFKFSLETRGFDELFTSPTNIDEAIIAVRDLLEQAKSVKRETLNTLDDFKAQGFVPISMSLQPIKRFVSQDVSLSLVYRMQEAKTLHIFDVFKRLEKLDRNMLQLRAAIQAKQCLVPSLFQFIYEQSQAFSAGLNKLRSDFGLKLVDFRAKGDEERLNKIDETLAGAEESVTQGERTLESITRRWSHFQQMQTNALSRTDIDVLFGTKEEIERDFNTNPKGLVVVIHPSHTTSKLREGITKAVWLSKWQLQMGSPSIVSRIFFLDGDLHNEPDLFGGKLRSEESNPVQILGWQDSPGHERVWFEVNQEVWFCQNLSDDRGRFAGQMKSLHKDRDGWVPHGSGLLARGDQETRGEWENGNLMRTISSSNHETAYLSRVHAADSYTCGSLALTVLEKGSPEQACFTSPPLGQWIASLQDSSGPDVSLLTVTFSMINWNPQGDMSWRSGSELFLCVQSKDGDIERKCSLHTNFCTDGNWHTQILRVEFDLLGSRRSTDRLVIMAKASKIRAIHVSNCKIQAWSAGHVAGAYYVDSKSGDEAVPTEVENWLEEAKKRQLGYKIYGAPVHRLRWEFVDQGQNIPPDALMVGFWSGHRTMHPKWVSICRGTGQLKHLNRQSYRRFVGWARPGTDLWRAAFVTPNGEQTFWKDQFEVLCGDWRLVDFDTEKTPKPSWIKAITSGTHDEYVGAVAVDNDRICPGSTIFERCNDNTTIVAANLGREVFSSHAGTLCYRSDYDPTNDRSALPAYFTQFGFPNSI